MGERQGSEGQGEGTKISGTKITISRRPGQLFERSWQFWNRLGVLDVAALFLLDGSRFPMARQSKETHRDTFTYFFHARACSRARGGFRARRGCRVMVGFGDKDFNEVKKGRFHFSLR